MDSMAVNYKAVAVFGGISVAVYLVAIALAPALAPDSGSTGVELVHYATAHRSQLLASYLLFALGLALLMVFAAGLYRIIRRAEGGDGWLAMASVASVVVGAADLRCRHRAVHGRRVSPGHRSRGGAGVVGRRLAGLQLHRVRVWRVDRDRRRGRASPPGAAAMDRMDRGPGGADHGFVGPFAVQTGTGPFSPQGWFALVVAVTFAAWVLAISLATWRSTRAPAMTSEHGRAHAGLG